MKKRIRLLMSIGLIATNSAFAQLPASSYVNSFNSYVPGSPEAAQITKYVDFPVDLSTGTPQISIPIYTLKGKGISVPISLSYHAGGGIKTNDQSTNVGLGWILNTGEITREVRGLPDETTGAGFWGKPHPLSYYLNEAQNLNVNNTADWIAALHGTLDLEPDIFYFSVGGASGKFIYDDSLSQFVCITSKGRLNISYTYVNSSTINWTIVTDDGTQYIFATSEASQSQQYYGSSTAWSPNQTTSWKLSKIINADKTDSIMFTYDYNAYRYYTMGSSLKYEIAVSAPQTASRLPVNSFSYNNISGISKLTGITGRNFSVSFVDDASNRLDIEGQQKAIAKIIVSDRNNNVQDIFKLYHSYFNRPLAVGPLPTTIGNQSLRLDSISEYGNSESNANPLTHTFTYNAAQLPTRLSYAQDFWGYPNYNTENSTLAPAMQISDIGFSQFYTGANRIPDTTNTILRAGILEKIGLPTGGSVQYQYEPNTLGYSVPFAAPAQASSISNTILQFVAAGQSFLSEYDATFTVNQPSDYYINFNDPNGGVMADISFSPVQTPPAGSTAPAIDYTYPYFMLEKTGEVPGNANGAGFSNTYQFGVVNSVHLPNGVYKMSAFVAGSHGLNQSLTGVRAFNFTTHYQQLNSSLHNNYEACGLRVKTITTTDPYANTTSVRSYKYHDPVTDSSYGRFIGNLTNHYLETAQSQNSDGGTWLVRVGSNDMPGQGSSQNSIIYLKVIEDELSGSTVSRTEHTYSSGVPFPFYNSTWPFIPLQDNDCSRGNETLTQWKKYSSGSFTTAKSRQQVFDTDPHYLSSPGTEFFRRLYGIKCTSDSYDGSVGTVGGSSYYLPPQFIQSYPINVNNRAYLTSDTTTTYDLNSTSNSITEWHDYTYGDNNQQPIITRSGNSDGSVSLQKNYYAMDQPDNTNTEINNMPLSQLIAANRVSEPLGTLQYKDGELLSQQYTYGHFAGSKLLTESIRQALFSNPLDVEVKVLTYDNLAEPLSIWLRGNKYRKYVWNMDSGLPLATCVSPQNDLFYFSSFEYPSDYGTSGSAFSGSKAFQLGSGSSVTINSTTTFGNEDVYVWATNGVPSVNGSAMTATAKTKGTWTLYKGHVTSGTYITISGSSLIDQLVVKPSGSQFQGNVYDAASRVIAKVNNQEETSFYQYDAFGRLTLITDEQGNILKSDTYQYQTAQ